MRAMSFPSRRAYWCVSRLCLQSQGVLRIGASMIAVLQRVATASVQVDAETVGAIGRGLLVLLAFERDDDDSHHAPFLERVLNLRVFADPAGKMNLSLRDVAGGLLLVPQFTLAADTASGRRPGFSQAADPARAQAAFAGFVRRAQEAHQPVASGRFGADMRVQLVNDGPATFILRS